MLVALIVGILIVNFFMNRMGMPGHRTGVPFPVFARVSFGVFGANIAALIRAAVGIAWYGIQTWLASVAVVVLVLAIFPGLKPWSEGSILGLSPLGWLAFATLWLLQFAVFWRGIEVIRRFIDFCGPAVYVVMVALAIWIVSKAGWHSLTLQLKDVHLSTGGIVYTMLMAIGLVVSYFSTLLLNFGDFARFAASPSVVRRGNFLGLPINFTAFSVVTVIVTAGTVSVFGQAITDPVQIVARIPNTFVLILGALGAVLGPLYGIMMADYYHTKQQRVVVDELFRVGEGRPYWYQNGVNLTAVKAFVPTAVVAILVALIPAVHDVAPFSWFIGAVLGAALYAWLAGRQSTAAPLVQKALP